MDIDPQQTGLVLRLSDDGKPYVFKPWSYRQWRALTALQNDKSMTLADYMDRAVALLVDGYSGDPDELQELTPADLLKLIRLRESACFPSPEDKKKSES